MHKKDILFIEAINVLIKTWITSLVAKRSLQLSHTMVFLNLSRSIINEKATIIIISSFQMEHQGFSLQLSVYLKRASFGKISD